ncbi:MAG: VOC family protein, partial [Phycisphaerae bacterium]
MTVQRIPDNYPTVMPYLLVERVDDLIAFTTAVFDAKVHSRLTRDDGSVMHAELQVGAGVIMAGEPVGVFGAIPGSVFVYTEDCDAAYSRALEAGATPVMEPTDMPH